MKKSLILTFVFAAFSFVGAFAQNISRNSEPTKPKEEKNVDKAAPTDARPGSEAPTSRPSEQSKGEKGKRKGHHKKHKGKGKAKGHHKSQHDKEGHEGHKHPKGDDGHKHHKGDEGTGRGASGKVEKAVKPPVDAPRKSRTNKQGGNQ